MLYSNTSKVTFDKTFSILKEYPVFKEKHPILAYSGGKDSTILLHLFHYLHIKHAFPPPVIFHLDHQIRNNQEQEAEIFNYLTSNFSYTVYCVKKKFLYYLRESVRA
jgi:tRNA(Ile)-lysidine synthase TilS/MesJ